MVADMEVNKVADKVDDKLTNRFLSGQVSQQPLPIYQLNFHWESLAPFIWGDSHHTFLFASLNWVLTPEVDSTLWRYNKLILYSFIIPGFLAFFGCSCFAPLVVLSPMVLLFYVFLLYYSTATTVAAGRPLGWDDSVLQGITKWVLFGSRPMRTRTQSVL